MDQTTSGGVWKPLGTFNLTPGQNHRVEISDRATGTVIPDALTFEWTGLTPPTAAWTPALARRDLYDVQARWPLSVPFQAPEANYKAVHEGGSTTTTVNQQTNYGQWNTLSPGLILDPAAGHRLELPGKASGSYVYADAARFVPSATLPRNVTWTFTPSSTGAHLVYAKWPAAATHTTQARFTIAHAGGSTDVTVNQRIQGGQWVLLGSFTMNASTAYTIALSDNPNGQVAADAVRIVPVVTSAEKFTWTPTIPSSGSYDVYARWVASSANTGSATYTVTHAGGASNVVVNQKQNGGTWVKLGSYSFTPSSGHKVELLGANDGRVVADGLRLVAASAQAANIAYIHPDHLGSPQKMTDTSQTLTWDAQFDPFGEEFLIAGSAVQPNRFPGQYADAETGYSYNYFRDYEPTIGRYVQSDPIGLAGGANTYAYVSANPLGLIDSLGLADSSANPNPSAPDWHKQRNRFNKCPEHPPAPGEIDCEGQVWAPDNPFSSWWYHGDGWLGDGNSTYRSPETSPHRDGSFQCTYDPNGNLVTSGGTRGTYDYANPDTDFWGHREKDVKPHDEYDGGYEDPDQTNVYDCDGSCDQ